MLVEIEKLTIYLFSLRMQKAREKTIWRRV